MVSAQVARYVLVGLLNTAVGYGCILLLRYGLDWHDLAANASGYGVGACMSYALNKRFTFNSQHTHRRAVPRYVLTICVCYALNAAMLYAGLHWLGLPSFTSQALSLGVYNVAFFLLSRALVFGPPEAA